MQHLTITQTPFAIPSVSPLQAEVDGSSFNTSGDRHLVVGDARAEYDQYVPASGETFQNDDLNVISCYAIFKSPKFSPVADPITSPRWVTLVGSEEDKLDQSHDMLSTRAENRDNEGAVAKQELARMEEPGGNKAIVASDSPIKGIIFSRTITDADFEPSPRGSKSASVSPRKSSSPRKSAGVGRKTVAQVKAELGFLEQPTAGHKGQVHVTSAEEAVLGCKSWDVTISSLTPRSVHDTHDSSSWMTPRVLAPKTLLSRQVSVTE